MTKEEQQERHFHTLRTMFAFVRGELRIAPARCPAGHREWLYYLTDEEFEHTIRGYYQGGIIHVYVGQDFLIPLEMTEEQYEQLSWIFKSTIFHQGAIPGPVGYPWRARDIKRLQHIPRL